MKLRHREVIGPKIHIWQVVELGFKPETLGHRSCITHVILYMEASKVAL